MKMDKKEKNDQTAALGYEIDCPKIDDFINNESPLFRMSLTSPEPASTLLDE